MLGSLHAGRVAGAWRCGGTQPAVCVNVKVSAGNGGALSTTLTRWPIGALASTRCSAHFESGPAWVDAVPYAEVAVTVAPGGAMPK